MWRCLGLCESAEDIFAFFLGSADLIQLVQLHHAVIVGVDIAGQQHFAVLFDHRVILVIVNGFRHHGNLEPAAQLIVLPSLSLLLEFEVVTLFHLPQHVLDAFFLLLELGVVRPIHRCIFLTR